ncbi:HlyD family efflux transporter periplasmic adaptor subunit [Rhizobium sp. WYCCWR 11279]|uniref:HlyD family efflux transporter periplasmic adaptor subunit n=1 Tax=Rhizobium changzhiense TaxID=2692317 RepID=UPI001490F4EA|nr:HlyD family efflux transporter periplasmic adaptor subunit [Rhizobium changzhiense]
MENQSVEAQNLLMEPLGRPRRARLWTSLAAGAAILGIGSGALLWQPRESETQSIGKSTPSERTIVVESQAVSRQLDIVGTIAAGKSVAIVAPFDGVIRERHVQLGDPVRVGDVLVVMDTSDIASRYRDAQSVYLKAAMAADALEKWVNGPDMLRAKRALDVAQGGLATLDRQVGELKVLLDQGIVSRNEFDNLVQQRDTQKNTVDGTRDELDATQARGNDDNRKLVMLELENAQSRLNDLKQQMAGAKVATAVAGILTRPPVNASNREVISAEPGASVTRGAALFAIADTSSFMVTGVVDEIDVNRIKIGQPVTIASDAFPDQALHGNIVSVSAEADTTAGARSPPKFQVRASFSAPGETLRTSIKIGMSARMTVETYFNPAALLVPTDAVSRNGDQAVLTVVDNKGPALVPVILGETFPAGIEVISGLNAGSTVKVPGTTRN